MRFLFLYLFVMVPFSLLAFESSDSFQIKIHDGYIKVIAPSKYDKTMFAVLENQTLGRVIGKIVTDKERLIATVAIESQASKSIDLKVLETEKLFFVPLSPPFQEVELIVGRREYEIPPKR